MKGVLVPGDQELPFRLKNQTGLRIEKNSKEDCGSASDDESLAEEKFSGLKASLSEQYRACAVGAMQSLLKDHELGEEEREAEAGKMQAAAKKRKQRKKTTEEGTATKPKRRGMFALAISDDETESDSAEAPRKKLRVVKAATPKPATEKKPRSSVNSVGSASRADPKDEDDDDEDGKNNAAGRGRAPTDIPAHADILWEQFQKADASSLFFVQGRRFSAVHWHVGSRSRAIVRQAETQSSNLLRKSSR
jgi:hypothetical protein